MKKRIVLMLLVVAMTLGNGAVWAAGGESTPSPTSFDDNQIYVGDSSDSPPTIKGKISSTMYDVTSPILVTWNIDQGQFTASPIFIKNSSSKDLLVSCASFKSTDISVKDVGPNAYDWNYLGTNLSSSEIAIGITPEDGGWTNRDGHYGKYGNTIWAIDTQGAEYKRIVIGELPPEQIGKISIDIKHGNAFETTNNNAFSHDLVLVYALG